MKECPMVEMLLLILNVRNKRENTAVAWKVSVWKSWFSLKVSLGSRTLRRGGSSALKRDPSQRTANEPLARYK